MEFSIKIGSPEKQRTNCLIVGVFKDAHLSDSAKQLDKASKQHVSGWLKKGDLTGKAGQTLILHGVPNLSSERVLLLGCGKSLKDADFKKIVLSALQALESTGAADATFCLAELTVDHRSIEWKTKKMVEWILESTYAFDQFKTKKKKKPKMLKHITLIIPNKRDIAKAEHAILEGQAIANGIFLAKDLGNLPGNVCTPTYLAKEAEKLAKQFPKIKTTVLNEKEMKSLKMGAFLSVTQGSQNPAKLITLEYRGRKDKQKPIVLVGKGITFDTGGNSLKPAMNMIGMKYDMCGAASVLGTLQTAAKLNLPLNIVGVIAAAENMPGNTATRPEDIVTTMSGLTVEILNTDAEGRLVLCDALTYCKRFNPEVVIDMATLTGACIVALGYYASAVLGNHQALANDLLDAGQTSMDRCWQLPLWDDYQELLRSKFADIANISSSPYAGTITAACFLSRFTKDYKWAHLDIAGAAFQSTGPQRGATGRPVSLLVQYLLDRCA